MERMPIGLSLLLLAVCAFPCLADGITVAHLYNLSDFSGAVPYSRGVRLFVDRQTDEIYASAGNSVQVFNESGMQIYSFGGPEFSTIRDLAVDAEGTIFVLSHDLSSPSDGISFFITRCDYRGDPQGRIAVHSLPTEFSEIKPDVLVHQQDGFFLASKAQMLGVATDLDGRFLRGYNFAELAGIPEEKRPDHEIFGFSMDAAGNMLFTVPILFRAFVVSPASEVRAFGRVGSAPGMFGIASGIVSDDQGRYLISDRRRSVVLIFDAQFNFITEFGYRGKLADSLYGPDELALGNAGKLYITQLLKRGVAVFSVTPQ